MKTILCFIIVILTSCSPLTHTNLLKFPPKDFKLDNKTLKTNGYYYCEKERIAYCKYISGITTGVIADTLSRYDEKYISAIFLYNDGYAYSTGSLITSGVNRLGATSSNDHCNLVKDFNTYESARENFESHLQKRQIGTNTLHDKGVYKINGDSISFQIYESGSHPLVFTEYFGNILNDTTFQITKTIRQQNTIPKSKPLVFKSNDTYHLKQNTIKADSTNYLRDNRAKLDK